MMCCEVSGETTRWALPSFVLSRPLFEKIVTEWVLSMPPLCYHSANFQTLSSIFLPFLEFRERKVSTESPDGKYSTPV